jgi:tetratricopeptide (TPR) repeat protein
MRLLPPLFLGVILVAPSALPGAQDGAQSTLETNASQRLADIFVRAARKATMTQPLDTISIMAAFELASEASRLAPQSPSVLQAMVEVAQMADLQEHTKSSIKELLLVAPTQTSLQLARLRGAIEMTNTVDQRMLVYEQLLSDGRSALLDTRIASRIALDAALLQRQVGNIEQFARWLAESVALDPSNPDAAILAAGFFGDESADAYTRAELLSVAMLSNIRDTALQVSLAEFLMAYGDYEDANAIYNIILGDTPVEQAALQDGLLADIALCTWAAGDPVLALDIILTRQIHSDKSYREQTRIQSPRLTPLELARIHAPLLPKLATVRAAIYADQSDNSITRAAIDSATGSLFTVAKLLESRGTDGMKTAVNLYLQASWITIWFGDDTEFVQTLLSTIEDGAAIDPVERIRLEGWLLLKKGEISTAITTLASLQDDPAAQAGLGLAYLMQGNKRAAAKLFLKVAKKSAGTILGVWSKMQLKKIVAADFDLRPEIQGLRQLMVGVLETLNDYVQDPRAVVGVYINPSLQTYSPYEPISIEIELTNNTSLPLTIAKNGPIRPFVLLEAQLQIPNTPQQPSGPIIVPINHQLSLLPNETQTVSLDLRQYWVGEQLDMFPINGASLKLHATVNFLARETMNLSNEMVFVYEPGTLGSTTYLDGLRVNGIRLNNLWLKDAIAKIEDITTIDDLTTFVLLTWIVGDDIILAVEQPLITPPPGEELTPVKIGERLKLQDDAITKLLTTFPSLGPISQAWIVSTMSNDVSTEALAGMLKDPESTVSQFSWLIRFAHPDVPDEALDDPKLLEAMSSENKAVKTVAIWVYSEVERVAKKRELEQLGPPQD